MKIIRKVRDDDVRVIRAKANAVQCWAEKDDSFAESVGTTAAVGALFGIFTSKDVVNANEGRAVCPLARSFWDVTEKN